MDLKETKLSSEPIYQGSFVTINRDKVRLPNGNESQRIVIRHPGAACVLAVTEEGKAVLVRQWRYAADAATLELPAGKLDAGDRLLRRKNVLLPSRWRAPRQHSEQR